MSAAAESGTISNLAIIMTLHFLPVCKNKLQLNTFITEIRTPFGDNYKDSISCNNSLIFVITHKDSNTVTQTPKTKSIRGY